MILQVEGLWELLSPLLRTALSNITVETYADWGTCIATACVSLFVSFVCLLPAVKFMTLLPFHITHSGESGPTQAPLAI